MPFHGPPLLAVEGRRKFDADAAPAFGFQAFGERRRRKLTGAVQIAIGSDYGVLDVGR